MDRYSIQSKSLVNKTWSKVKQDGENNKPSIGERIGKWDVTKNNLHWILGLSAIALIGLFFASCFNSNSNLTDSLIGTIGGLASLFGIYLTLCQIIEAKKDIIKVAGIANAAKIATEETRQSIRKTISISQVVKNCEQIKRIQESLMHSELKIAIHLTQELQDAVIELNNHLKSFNIEFDENGMTNHIKKMGMNIGFLRTSEKFKIDGDKRDGINRDFDNLLKIMFDLKAKLTTYYNEGT